MSELSDCIGERFILAFSAARFEKTVLVEGISNVDRVLIQAPVIIGFMNAGYRPVILLFAVADPVEAAYRLLGVRDFIYYADHLDSENSSKTSGLVERAVAGEDIHEITYRGHPAAKFAVSTQMRRTRRGRLNFADEANIADFSRFLTDALDYVDAAAAIIKRVTPDAVAMIDRGYTPSAQVFQQALLENLPVYTMNAGHKNDILVLKRYTRENQNVHPSSLSEKSWNIFREMTWDDEDWRSLLAELSDCYRSGQWYGEVGTQVNKSVRGPQALRDSLQLDPRKKTAVIFPHLFWDATFFWGVDVFDNYEEWFVETLRAACENDRLNWIIKVHPANLVKDRRDGYRGENSETVAIRNTIGELPPHVKLIRPDSDISTFSLFSIMDYCLTVRGTVGIEAACFGIPVLTAGTGRYDRQGFTVDSGTTTEYLARVARLPDVPRLDERQTELARRYAYGVFLARPAPLSSIGLRFMPDTHASLDVTFRLSPDDDFRRSEDLLSIAHWIESGDDDFLWQPTLPAASGSGMRCDP